VTVPPFDLATVGDNCIDRFLPPVGLSTVGGNAVNVGVHLARLGHQVAYLGAIGKDEDGRRVQAALARNGLELAGLRIAPTGQTAFTEIATTPDGDREIRFEEFGACRGYRPTDADLEQLKRKRHIHIGWLDDGGALKRKLVHAGVSVSQDLSVNVDPIHASADDLSVAFASAGPSEDTADALLRQALSAGARVAVVTCGRLGSCASDGRGTVAVPAVAASIVDTTGAGDSFIAGFLSAHLSGADLEKSLRAGADLAAATCNHLGGFPQRTVPFT
jgi:fructoselysine 6-kinase